MQKAGHYLDSLAASIDMPLEEEELYADQLKEYLFYAGALQAVCRRQETLQLQLEKAEAHVASCITGKDNVEKGEQMCRVIIVPDSYQLPDPLESFCHISGEHSGDHQQVWKEVKNGSYHVRWDCNLL
jgi:hypothetical protein